MGRARAGPAGQPRHLLTHLLFLAGGLGAAALGLFLLHPRLYAHSFFNSKDLPFLNLFMLALLLTHWAFRRGTGPAFLLCGLGVGVLANVRPMGLLLGTAVLALRLCDGLQAADRAAARPMHGGVRPDPVRRLPLSVERSDPPSRGISRVRG